MMQFMGRQNDRPPYNMPLVVRAREYHLYDRYGRRYVDFYQNHGRAILGHRPDGMIQAIKGTVARGLVADYPTVHLGRLVKIVEQLLSGYRVVRLYNGKRHTVEALHSVFGSGDDPLVIADPALGDTVAGQAVALWRPFLADSEVNAEVLIPILPFPGNFVCELVCVRDDTVADQLPPSDTISPLVLDLMVKATGALLRLGEEKRQRFFHRTAIHELLDRTNGPYGTTGLGADRYGEFCTAALDAGVVLPPTQSSPIIVPPELSAGEMARFLPVAQQFLGNE